MDGTRVPRYNSYGAYLKRVFGEKVYKLPVNVGATCPNRDGTLACGGCLYCGEDGGAFEGLPATMGVSEQLARNKEYIGRRYGARKFIAYFQTFSNTYLPLPRFVACMEEACLDPDLAGLAIATRPDCVRDDYLSFLAELSARRGVGVELELGLQTVNYRTLAAVRRGHGLAEFIDAVLRAREHGLTVCAHLILNLPGDERLDVVETARVVSALRVAAVKLHALYVLKDTPLGADYLAGRFIPVSAEEYIERVILFLEHLHPDIAVQRLLGRAPAARTLFCNWGLSWRRIHERIVAEMEARDTRQGRRCDYLNGKALAHLSLPA